MNITLYGVASYDRGGKARWLMEEMGIPYQDHWLDTEKNERESEAYRQINPIARIPAITMGNQKIFESSAICAYLADQYLDKGMAPPLQSSDRADYQQWMYFAASTVDPYISRIMIIEDIPAGEVLDQKQTALMEDFTEVVQYLDQVLSKKDYLVANRFGAADICVSYHFYFCSLWPEMKTVMDSCPHFTSYMKRLAERPAAIQSKVFSYEA